MAHINEPVSHQRSVSTSDPQGRHEHRRRRHREERKRHRRRTHMSGTTSRQTDEDSLPNRRRGYVTEEEGIQSNTPLSTLTTQKSDSDGKHSRRVPQMQVPKLGDGTRSGRARQPRTVHVDANRHRTAGATKPSKRSSQTGKQSIGPIFGGDGTLRKTNQPSKTAKRPAIIPSPVDSAHEAPSQVSQKKPPFSAKDLKKNQGFFHSFLFGSPPAPERKITCLTCFCDDIPIHRSAKLACSHRMCHSCLKRIFTMSVKDPQHMPPRCCTSDHIPLKHVDKLFDTKFKTQWNKKYQEYTTKNRIYCPAKGCGEWIKPNNIYLDTSSGATGGRKYGKCSRCKTKVCCICNGKWHSRKDCPKDEDTKNFVEVAKEKGWQRCYNCSAMVELKEGCNHMTCRCTAEFCIICGSKWKTCECPWFNYGTVAAGDRLNHMNVAEARQVYADADGEWRNPIRYQEEIDRRHQQEREDEAIARRLQQQLGFDDVDDIADGAVETLLNFGNTGPNFLNEQFVLAPRINGENARESEEGDTPLRSLNRIPLNGRRQTSNSTSRAMSPTNLVASTEYARGRSLRRNRRSIR